MRELESNPHLFGFVAVLRKLECIHDDRPRLGESARASEDPVRLGQDPSLIFAPREISMFRAGSKSTPDRLDTYAFGLFGPNGPMPHHISELVHSRELNEGDRTLRAFADTFHHRLTSLFYRAVANASPAINMDRPGENRFDVYIGSILGIGPSSFRARDAMPDSAKLFNASILAMHTRPASALADLLENYFRLPFEIEELVGEWLTLADEDRMSLGVSACRLGEDSILGKEIWSCQHRFRIVAGPLSLEEFERFMPGQPGVATLLAVVTNFIGEEFAWDAQLILKKDDVPGVTLGQSAHLGWTTWLGTRPSEDDAEDVIIDLHRAASIDPASDDSNAGMPA